MKREVLLLFLLLNCDLTPVKVEPVSYTCSWNGVDSLLYLNKISCPDEFNELSGSPIVPTLNNVSTVKAAYEISTKQVYFISADKYYIHFDFCAEVLNYKNSHQQFNTDQYGSGPERLYYLATINHYRDSDIFTLEFFADDRISLDGIRTLFTAVRDSTFFGKELKLFPSSTKIRDLVANAPEIPCISADELYGAQIYQALNPQEGYGWLRKIDISQIDNAYLGRHDIVVVNGVPLDIPVISGIITTDFQTPLSHVNVLSHNRGTPNMALKNAWSNPEISKLDGKLVHLVVTSDTFLLYETTADKAQAFWDTHEPKDPKVLECNDDTAGLFDMNDLSHESIPIVGAKAANFAELTKIKLDGNSLPVPEASFAIPFYYYRLHMKQNKLDLSLENMLRDSLFNSDQKYKESLLSKLRDNIENSPLDQELIRLVEQKIRAAGNYSSIRFRSSTNVEDIEGFNGAGLYESHTAKLNDPKKTIEKAIKKVYASLWTFRGFEEREYFKIDHRSAAMGILVHRSFSDEQANGVAITKNIYFPYVPAYTINVQIKGISVVSPPQGFIADQLLFHVFNSDAYQNPAIEFISHSNVNDGISVLTEAETAQLARWLTAIKQRFYYSILKNTQLDYYQFAMDVEFKFDGPDRKLYIKQARPY